MVGACGDGNTPPMSEEGTTDPSSAEGDATTDAGDGDSSTASSESGESGDSGEESDTGNGCMHETIEGGAADGSPCSANDACESNLCLSYAGAPYDPEAVCEAPPSSCRTRATGRVLRYGTGTPVPGLDIKVIGAIASSSNPVGAAALGEGQTDQEGRFDLITDDQLEQPIGIVGVVSGDGHQLSTVPLAAPLSGLAYGPANEQRDLWAVPQTELDAWNLLLQQDSSLSDHLPMGDEGGVLGLVREQDTGVPVAGATVESTDGAASTAFVRYLNEAGDAFDASATGTSGIFVVLDPAQGEDFDAFLAGEPTTAPTGKAVSVNGSVFVMVMGI
jgi:hypothetical protein